MVGAPQFVRVDADGPDGRGLPLIAHDTSDTPVDGARHPRGYAAFTYPSGVLTAGVWACDAGTIAIEDLLVDEACYLLEGEVVLTDQYGNTETYREGEGFLLQRGFTGTRHMPRPVRKYNAMFRR